MKCANLVYPIEMNSQNVILHPSFDFSSQFDIHGSLLKSEGVLKKTCALPC